MPGLPTEKESMEYATIILKHLKVYDNNTIILLNRLELANDQLICEAISKHFLNTYTYVFDSSEALQYYLHYIEKITDQARFIIDSLRDTPNIFNLGHLKLVSGITDEDSLFLTIFGYLFKKRVPFETAKAAKADYLNSIAVNINLEIDTIFQIQIINAFSADPEFNDYLLYLNFVLNKEGFRKQSGSLMARSFPVHKDIIDFLIHISRKFFPANMSFSKFATYDVVILQDCLKVYLRSKAVKQFPTFPQMAPSENISPTGITALPREKKTTLTPLLDTRQTASRTKSPKSVRFTLAKESLKPPGPT